MSFFNLGSTVPAVFQAIHLQVRRETYQTGWGSPEAEGSPANWGQHAQGWIYLQMIYDIYIYVCGVIRIMNNTVGYGALGRPIVLLIL